VGAKHETELAFRGGDIDGNLLRLYVALEKSGRLLARELKIDDDDHIETQLMAENIIYSSYLDGFHLLLTRLNKKNRSAVFHTGKRMDVHCKSDCRLLVPDLKSIEFTYYTPLTLKNETLQAAAYRNTLYRPFDREKRKRVYLKHRKDLLQQLRRLNPKLTADRDILDIRNGQIVFPAEGFRMLLPSGAIEHESVRAIIAQSHVYTNVPAPAADAKPQSVASQADEANASPCRDADVRTMLPYWNAMHYVLPENVRKRRVGGSAVIVDKFPVVTAGPPPEVTYMRQFAAILQTDSGVTPELRNLLELSRKNLGISEERSRELETRAETWSEKQYDLASQPEFVDAPAGVPPSSELPYDPEQDHGIHVASVIGAHCNGYGISGVLPNAQLFAYNLKTTGTSEALNDIIGKIGCETPCIINASVSWAETSIEAQPIKDLKNWRNRLLVVAASGNAVPPRVGAPLGSACPLLPACLGATANVITVTASSGKELHPQANYNNSSQSIVTIAAPGDEILGTIREGRLVKLSGTSQAAAFVTGALALLQNVDQDLSVPQLRRRVLYTADLEADYNGRVKFGNLNIARSITGTREDLVDRNEGGVLRGYFEYVLPNRSPRQILYVYPGGRSERVPACAVPRIRRIARDEATALYNVVCERETEKDSELEVFRGVALYPPGPSEAMKQQLSKLFVLATCTEPTELPENVGDVRQAVDSCRSKTSIPIRLDQIKDLVVRAHAR